MILWMLACGPSEPDDTGATPTDTLPEGSVTYALGSSAGQTPSGSYVAESEEILFVRTLDPAASTITEDVWTVGADGLIEFHLTQTVADDTFSASFDTPDGLLEVEGAFDAGEPWAWTAWHSTSVYATGQYAGTRVSSTDLATETTLHADKVVTDADGVEIWLIEEALDKVDEATWQARFDAVAP